MKPKRLFKRRLQIPESQIWPCLIDFQKVLGTPDFLLCTLVTFQLAHCAHNPLRMHILSARFFEKNCLLISPLVLLSEIEETTTTAYFPIGSRRSSHVLFFRSEHRFFFDSVDQSIYLSRWVPHSVGHYYLTKVRDSREG
jgi:hypothetical protein